MTDAADDLTVEGLARKIAPCERCNGHGRGGMSVYLRKDGSVLRQWSDGAMCDYCDGSGIRRKAVEAIRAHVEDQVADARRKALDDGIVRGYVLAVATLAHNPAASSSGDLQDLLRAAAITRRVAVAAGVDVDLDILDVRKGWPR